MVEADVEVIFMLLLCRSQPRLQKYDCLCQSLSQHLSGLTQWAPQCSTFNARASVLFL